MLRVLGIIAVLVVLSGCASDLEVAYPHPRPSVETGAVLIKFTEPIRQVHVQVDGIMVVEDEHTERILIDAVPVGVHEVGIAASEGHRAEAVQIQRTVDVQADQTTTILVGTPPTSSGFWVYLAAAASMYWLIVDR